MKVEAIALSDFIHGDINAVEGKLLRHRNGSLIDSSVAGDLERAGLARIRTTPTPAAVGKSLAAGEDQPSSSLPAAPVSPMTTSDMLKRGPGRPRKDASLP